ncbi:hypothetical protein TNCV_1548311 [Trichonephila clavipes]|nr:hypothetical protein TNCV_1548311 [Trichonephila clavipes]
MFEKVSVLMDCATVSFEEFVAVDDYNVCTTPIMADKDILELDKKNTIGADSNYKNKRNKAALVSTSFEVRYIMKNMRIYLHAHSKGQMNNKMEGIEKLVDPFMLKKTMQRKLSNYFPEKNINV